MSNTKPISSQIAHDTQPLNEWLDSNVDTELRADLASGDSGKGTELVVHKLNSVGAVVQNLHKIIDQFGVNPNMFGADASGLTDSAPAFRSAFLFAVANRAKVVITDGDYLLNSVHPDVAYQAAVFVQSDFGLVVECSSAAKIIGGAGLSVIAGGAMIRIDRADRQEGTRVEWRGGIFDLSAIPGGATTCDGLSVGPKYKSVVVDGVIFDHGVQTPTGSGVGQGGGDSGLYCKEPVSISVTNCQFLGAPDIGVYLTGPAAADLIADPDRYGKDAVFVGNRFYRCVVGVAAKRNFKEVKFFGNEFEECGDPVLAGTADSITDNQGQNFTVVGNTINKSIGTPLRLINAGECTVIGNRIYDYRRLLSDDGVTETPVAAGNRGAAIKLEGCLRPVVVGNSVGFRDWLPVSTSNKESYGIIIGTFGTTGTTDGMITNNVIENCHAPFYISNESNGNSVCLNQDKNCIAETVVGAGINASNVTISADTGLGFAYASKRVFSAIADGLTVARFAGALSAVNYIELANSVTGAPAEVRARGADTFIDLMLTPRGSGGRVRYGTHTATSDTAITGYIEIKDSAGTVRRLAVIS